MLISVFVVKMQYSKREIGDMHLMNRRVICNANEARRLCAETSSNRRVPNAKPSREYINVVEISTLKVSTVGNQ